MKAVSLKSNGQVFIAFAIVILIVFGNALFNGFVYDDHYLIKDNSYIKDFSHLGEVLTSDVAVVTPIGKPSGYYRPVAMLFLMAMYKIWGLNSFGLHLMSLWIHLLNTFLVFFIVSKLAEDRKLGIATGLLFAVHPIHVEAVTPIFNYMGILATFFSLAALGALIKARGKEERTYFFLSVVLFALAMFSKEEAIAMPGIFLLYDFLFLSEGKGDVFLKRAGRYLWFLLPILFYVAARLLVMQKTAALGFWNLDLGFSVTPANLFVLQVLTVFQIFAKYIWLLLFPFKLSAYYLLPEALRLTRMEIFLSIAAVLGLMACGFYCVKRNRPVAFFIFFFFIGSLMFTNLIPIGGLFAERFMYLPSISYCFLIAYLLMWFLKNEERGRRAKRIFLAWIIFLALVGLYAQSAATRNYVWRHDIILWLDTAQKTPQSYRPFQYLANAYVYYGRDYYEKALNAYQEALKRPGAPEVDIRNAMGTVYGLMGRHEEALAQFQRALALSPQVVVGYYNVGITYFFKGDNANALTYFKQAQKVDKDYFWVYYGMGLVYEKEQKYEEARALFDHAVALKPDFEMGQKALTRLP